jgi:hypothetical protein
MLNKIEEPPYICSESNKCEWVSMITQDKAANLQNWVHPETLPYKMSMGNQEMCKNCGLFIYKKEI